MKANHNLPPGRNAHLQVVSNGSKILIWKQITTNQQNGFLQVSCFQWFKDTNLKANHNILEIDAITYQVVSNGSKILIWKQITTHRNRLTVWAGCFQWFKDTNLKANHNKFSLSLKLRSVVSNGSKILIWKQITTYLKVWHKKRSCFQWFKDTNLKANHNLSDTANIQRFVVSNGSKILIWKQITTPIVDNYFLIQLFPMVQRY